MRRASDSSSIEKTIDQLVDRLTGTLESSVDARAREIVFSWSRAGSNGKSHPTPLSAPTTIGAPAGETAFGGRSLIPLPRAERDFRVSYLRALLARAPNRREAARRAGVPYRTLCDMVRKLRIAG